MSKLFICVADVVKEEYRTTMLHSNMNLSRIIVYALYIEESKLGRVARTLKTEDIVSRTNLSSRRELQYMIDLVLLW